MPAPVSMWQWIELWIVTVGPLVGYLLTMPGEWVAGGGMPPGDSFLINIRLVR